MEGEFNNELLRDVAELIGCEVCTTAAESPWSIGVVERHNAILDNMILKIIDSTDCSVQNALVLATSAKNALHNNDGFSPNQLVFGRNPNLPSVLSAKPPALRDITPSKLIAEHLNTLHAARKAFVECESSKKIKTALKHQTRTSTSKTFLNGDKVYYKRDGEKGWRGPAIVIGVDGKQLFIRHGGSCVRVSPCHVQSVRNTVERSLPDPSISSSHAPNMVESSENILVESSSSSSQTLPERESDIVMPPTMLESDSTTDTNFNSESEHPTPMTTPKKNYHLQNSRKRYHFQKFETE